MQPVIANCTQNRKLGKSAPIVTTILVSLEYISQFTNDIRYIRGDSSVVADTLSRAFEVNAFKNCDFCLKKIYTEQQIDSELLKILQDKDRNLNLKQIEIPQFGIELWCEVSQNSTRPYVPNNLRKVVFEKLHSISHPGIRATRKLISHRYFWPDMNK